MADDTSRIPGRQGTTPFSKSGTLSLPPSGTVVMASVEEDHGDGVYTLKWGRNRIQVTSKSGLTKGQSLILKSETSPEGKARLVVQGPALPNKHATGRVAYGPNIGNTARNAAAQTPQPSAAPATGTTGQGVAAGVSQVQVPSGAAAPKNAASLMGLVLEPLEDWRATADAIIESVNEGKKTEEEKQKEQEKKEREQQLRGETGDARASRDGEGKREPLRIHASTVKIIQEVRNQGEGVQLGQGNGTAISTGGLQLPGAQDPETTLMEEISEKFKQSAKEQAEKARERSGLSNEQNSPTDQAKQTKESKQAIPTIQTIRSEAGVAAHRDVDNSAALTARAEAANAAAAAPSAAHRAALDVFVKEALAQLVKAAALPLGTTAAVVENLGVPEKIADKAADILLRASGLAPTPSTVEAAKALLSNNLPVDRQMVQAVLELAAGSDAGQREALIKAAARLAAHDIPMSPPLAGGLADVISRRQDVVELAGKATQALAAVSDVPEAKALAQTARQTIEMLHVDLDSRQAPQALERYVSTFGRETMGRALALVETAAQATLEQHPVLPRIDQALTQLLTLLSEAEMVEQLTPPPAQPDRQARPVDQANQPVQNPQPAPGAQATPPATVPPGQTAPIAVPPDAAAVVPQPQQPGNVQATVPPTATTAPVTPVVPAPVASPAAAVPTVPVQPAPAMPEVPVPIPNPAPAQPAPPVQAQPAATPQPAPTPTAPVTSVQVPVEISQVQPQPQPQPQPTPQPVPPTAGQQPSAPFPNAAPTPAPAPQPHIVQTTPQPAQSAQAAPAQSQPTQDAFVPTAPAAGKPLPQGVAVQSADVGPVVPDAPPPAAEARPVRIDAPAISPINAYLRTPKIIDVANLNLPPMPQVASLSNTPGVSPPHIDPPSVRPEVIQPAPAQNPTPPQAQVVPETAGAAIPTPPQATPQPAVPESQPQQPAPVPSAPEPAIILPDTAQPAPAPPSATPNQTQPPPAPAQDNAAAAPVPAPPPSQGQPLPAPVQDGAAPAPEQPAPPPTAGPPPPAPSTPQPQPAPAPSGEPAQPATPQPAVPEISTPSSPDATAPTVPTPSGPSSPAIPSLPTPGGSAGQTGATGSEQNASARPAGPGEIQTGEAAQLGQSKENALASAGKELQFQTPGLNKPEFELLKPSGYLEHFLSLERSGGEVREKVAAEARTLLRDLLSDDPQRAMEGMRQLPGKDKEVLRETARQLTRMEQEILRSDNNLRSLAEAATSIRDLGRQALAVKAENLAARDREPGVMLAEVPFKLADDTGSGRMQMFYRQSRGKKEGWTSRVILDLNTTSMGPVLGDMRFFGSDMVLNMFVEKQDIADFLATSAADLVDALRDKGFRMRPRFMVLPPPPPPPEIRAERPDMADAPADSDTPISPSGKKGLLDTKA